MDVNMQPVGLENILGYQLTVLKNLPRPMNGRTDCEPIEVQDFKKMIDRFREIT